MLSMAAHAAAVQDCRHDVAPVEVGRYAADKKNDVVVSEEVIPVGTTVTMSYKVGDMVGWVTCRTTKIRKHATVKGGETYDIGCGNVIRKAEKAASRKEEPVVASAPVPEKAPAAECGIDGCGNVTQTRTITNIVQEKTICRDRSGRDFAPNEKGVCDFPQVTAVLPLDVSTPSKAPCFTDGCQTRESAKAIEWRPAAETTLKFCAIRTDKGEIVGLFNHKGFVQVVKMTKENVKPDGTEDFSNNPKAHTFESQPVSYLNNGDCKTTTNTVVAYGWAAVVEKLDLEKSCKVTRREWRGAENRVTVRS